VPGIVPARQFFLFRIIRRIALLEGFLLTLEPGHVRLGCSDFVEVVSHSMTDQLMGERIKGWAGGLVVLHSVGNGVHPTINDAWKTDFEQRPEARLYPFMRHSTASLLAARTMHAGLLSGPLLFATAANVAQPTASAGPWPAYPRRSH